MPATRTGLGWMLGVFGVVVLVPLVSIILIRSSGDAAQAGAPTPPRSLAVIDPKTREVEDAVELSGSPAAVAVGEQAVWVANPGDGTVLRIDPARRELVKPIGVGVTPETLAVDEAGVWVAEGTGPNNFAALTRIDPRTDRAGRILDFDLGAPTLFAMTAGGAVWVRIRDNIYKVDQQTLEVLETISGVDADALAVGEDGVWAPEATDHVVTRLDPVTNLVRAVIPFEARQPAGVVVGEGAAWVTDSAADRVWKIDPVTDGITATITVGDGPAGLAVGFGAVWVANRFDGTVSRIDPKTDRVTKTIKVAGRVAGIAAGEGAVWVAVP